MAVVETQGIILQRGDGGSPEGFNAIGKIVSIAGPDGEASEIDVTALDSVGKEFLMGLKDEGGISLTLHFDPDDTQQAGLRTDRDNRTKRNFRLILPDPGATQLDFAAFVKSFALDNQIDSNVQASVSLRITGSVTWS